MLPYKISDLMVKSFGFYTMSRQPNNASLTPVLRPTQFSRRRTSKSSIATKLQSIPVYSHISGNIDMEIDKYTTYIIEVKDPHSLEFDPGYFFRIKEKEFPLLSVILKRVLSVPASSVPSESLFSLAGLIQTDQRNRLNPTMLGSLTFLKE